MQYSGKGVEGLHEQIEDMTAQFIRLIEEKYLSTDQEFRPVDLARKIRYLTLDIISKLAFGEAFGFLEKDTDLFGYFKTTEETVPLIQVIAMIPWLIGLLQSPLFKALLPSEKDTVGLGKIMGCAPSACQKMKPSP